MLDYYTKWRRPSSDEVKNIWSSKKNTAPVKRLKDNGVDVFKTLDIFKKLIRTASVEIIEPYHQLRHHAVYSSFTILEQIEGIDAIKKIERKFKNNQTLPMPIILRHNRKDYLLSGNTVLNIYKITKTSGSIKALIIEIKEQNGKVNITRGRS